MFSPPKSAPLPRKKYGGGGPYGGEERNYATVAAGERNYAAVERNYAAGERKYAATLSRTKSTTRGKGGLTKYQFIKRKPLFGNTDENRR
jgi:hypothetical protein